MKVLLLGAAGQLGRTFLADKRLAARGELVAGTRHGDSIDGTRGVAVDLADPVSLAHTLDAVHPDIIINTAAYNAVDKAESEPTLADRINHLAVSELGLWAARHGARIVHYSSDYVFDGNADRPYKASDDVHPLSVYGQSKADGERALLESGATATILRTAWVHSPFGNNFLLTMLRLAQEGRPLNVVSDQVGTPTSTKMLVDGTLATLDIDPVRAAGIAHLVASGTGSWFDFARETFECAIDAGLLTERPAMQPTSSSEFVRPAKRPAYSVMDNADFADRFGYRAPDWRQGVDNVVRQLAKH